MHFHPEPLLKDDSRMAVCEQCFRITCGVCKAPCSADRPVGPPPIGQDGTDPHTLALAKRCLETKAKAQAQAQAKAKAEAEKVIVPDSCSDTESDDDGSKSALSVAKKDNAAKAMPPPPPRKRMTAEERDQLAKSIEARKRKIADMQKKSAAETTERVAKAKKAKLDSKAVSKSSQPVKATQ
jgi:hypothetical protein